MNWRFLSSQILFPLGFVAVSAVASAQSPSTLPDAIEKAVLQNPEVKLRHHNLQAAQQEKRSAAGGWLPRIDVEAASGTNQYQSPSTPSALNYSSNRASLQLRQMLFDGFATQSEVRRLSYGEQVAYYELLSASNQTALEVARAYIDVLRFRELVDLAAVNYRTHLDVSDRIAEKVAAGVGRRVDLEQTTGRLALAESNWLTEVSNLHDVSARYQRLVGDIPAENLAPLPPLGEFLPVGIGYLGDATRSNPDFLGAVATIRAYRADRELRKAANYPTLELRARQSHQTNVNGVTGDFNDSAIEVVLNYNLYRGGSDSARIKQYAAKLESAFDLRDKACRDIYQTGQIAFNDSLRLVTQLKLLGQHELSTSKAKQAYQQQFDIGQRSLLDLLDTENELYQARRALVNADHDLRLSDVRVLTVSGSLLEALKLKPLAADSPQASGGAEADDELQLCSDRIIPTLVLDRETDRRLPAPPKPTPPVVPNVVPVQAPPPVKPGPDEVCRAELQSLVETWIGAWNRKDLQTYLGTYADSFVPAKGLSRKAWDDLRKSRLNKKGGIQASIHDIKPISCDPKKAEVAFSQTYGSTDYSDDVEKTLSLERAADGWKIVRETVTKGRTF
jgi:outer membrane protein, adhesin transport system